MHIILPPFSAPEGYKDAFCPQEEKASSWFIFSGEKLLLEGDGKSLPNNPGFTLKRKLYIGTFENRHLFAGEIDTIEKIPEACCLNPLRTLFGVISDEHYALAGRAMQLLHWDRSHKFCGCCGQETFTREKERCRECPSCGHLAYPKLSPAIMVLIKKGNKILLARGHNFPGRWYSVIAGFVDPGETLEQCVHREVFEEVKLKIKSLAYFGSQPWPFSGSLMIAFTSEWEEGEIEIDPREIAEAAWFDYDNLPDLPPPLSISRILINSQRQKND